MADKSKYEMPEANGDGTYKITQTWYREKYLKSNEWRQIRDYMLRNSGGKCAVCGGKNKLQVHHKSYEALERAGKDDNSGNLVVLCDRCHADIHSYSDSLQGVAFTSGAAFSGRAINNAIFGNARSASAVELDLANASMRRKILVSITDAYVFSRAKEFSEKGDYYMLTHGNQGGINTYLNAILNWDPSGRAMDAWRRIAGYTPAECGISYGRYMGLYKAISSRSQDPWGEIRWKNGDE